MEKILRNHCFHSFKCLNTFIQYNHSIETVKINFVFVCEEDNVVSFQFWSKKLRPINVKLVENIPWGPVGLH